MGGRRGGLDAGRGTPLTFSHTELRREARDFLHDVIADLCDLHDALAENPAIWTLQSRFPRLP